MIEEATKSPKSKKEEVKTEQTQLAQAEE